MVSRGEAAVARHAIVADNKVLTTVRDQVITVVDVMKKMDMVFYQQFPQYRSSSEARFEFYKTNWTRVLEDLIDRQLILMWAEEKGIQVTNGEIREELEEMVGPDVMMNLYEAGLSIRDVQEMVKADILLRRILYFFVQKQITDSITPELVKAAYQDRLKNKERCEELVWRMVTIKKKQGDCPREVAEKVWKELKAQHLAKEQVQLPEGVEVLVSSQFRTEKKEVSPQVQEVLEMLAIGECSSPSAWTGRSDKNQSWRFYILDAKKQKDLPSFAEMEGEIRNEIAGPEIATKTKSFFADLRKQYHVKTLLSAEQLSAFEPFQMKTDNAA
jgi:hypothetical protein